MKRFKFIAVSLAAMVVLAGCSLRGNDTVSGSFGSGSADYGNATRANMATQIIDPAPANAQDPPKVDGQVILGGYGRYRTDKVKRPEPIGGF